MTALQVCHNSLSYVSGLFVEMIGNTRSFRFANCLSLVLVILAGNVVWAARVKAVTSQVIEILFTSSDLPITGGAVIAPPDRPIEDLQIYNLHVTHSTEAKLF